MFLRAAAASLLMLASPIAAQAPAASAPLRPASEAPIEAFAQLPFLLGPQISPDGTKIAGQVTMEGRTLIGVWNLGASRDAAPQLFEMADFESFMWVGNQRLLIAAQSMEMMITPVWMMVGPARRFVIHDLGTGEDKTLETAPGLLQDIIFADPHGRFVLLSKLERNAQTPSVHRIDLATQESVLVQPAVRGVWSWFADSTGAVRAGIDYGERRTRIYYRPHATARLVRLETRQDLLEDSIVESIRFVSDSNRGIIGTNAVSGRFAVYDYDFATATRGAALFEHPEVDVTNVVVGPDGNVDGFTYDDDRPRVRWIDPAMARVQAALDNALPGRTNIVLNASADGNRLLIFSWAADDPGTYYVYDQAARRLEVFASPYSDLHGYAFAPVRAISYRSRDGQTIHGYLTLPPGQPERGLPLIVLPHGGPFLRDRWIFDPQVQFLASRGYAVLQPNFRGSTGYGREFVERGYGQLGTGMIDDIDDGAEWLVQEGIADRSRVCIMGSSYGGYAAIWAAMRSPERYRCAISWAGPTDLPAQMRHDTRFVVAQRYIRERRRQLRGDEESSLSAVSPLRHPEMLRVPLLIGHGQHDGRVPVRQSTDLIRALNRRNASNVESIIYPKAAHDFTTVSESTDFLRRVEAFLARHNPARTHEVANAGQ